MMQHASGGVGQRVPTDVNALVEESVTLAYHGKRAQAPDFRVRIERDYGDGVGEAELMRQEIGRVLLNLLSNAFEAVEEQAETAGDGYRPTVHISTRRGDGHVTISVADNGVGIRPEDRARVFDPFFTTRPAGAGTGLGLSLSYDIVVQGHGGTLAVESEEGAGTAFVVSLPA